MNKYAYTLLKEIQTQLDEDYEVSFEFKISDLFTEEFNEVSWLLLLVKLELIYGFEIPESLLDQVNLNVLQFGEKLSELPRIPNVFYPEFYELKHQGMDDVLLLAQIEAGLAEGTQEEIDEIKERLDAIDKRIKEISELPLN